MWCQPDADNQLREIGGTGGTWEYRRTLYGGVGNDDFALTPEYLWLSSGHQLYLRAVRTSAPASAANVETVSFPDVVDVTSIDDTLYAMTTGGVVWEYQHAFGSARAAASYRFGVANLPLPAASYRFGVARDSPAPASRRFGTARSSPFPAWLRHRLVDSPAAIEPPALRLGAPAPARPADPGSPLSFTGGLAADQAPGSRKFYAIAGNVIREFEGDGLNPLATELRTFPIPSPLNGLCIAVDGDLLFGSYSASGNIIALVGYAIPASGTALTQSETYAVAEPGTVYGLSLRRVGSTRDRRGRLLYLSSTTNEYRVLEFRMFASPFVDIVRTSVVDSSLVNPRSLACTFDADDNPAETYVGERGGRIFAYAAAFRAGLGARVPRLDFTIPEDAAIQGLTIDPEGIMYAMPRQPGDVYSITFRPQHVGPASRRFGVARRALASAWGRHRITDSEVSTAWGRHRSVSSEQKTAWRRWRAAAGMLKSAWYRHGPVPVGHRTI